MIGECVGVMIGLYNCIIVYFVVNNFSMDCMELVYVVVLVDMLISLSVLYFNIYEIDVKIEVKFERKKDKDGVGKFKFKVKI